MIAQVEIEQLPDSAWTLLVNGTNCSEAVSGIDLRIDGAGKPAHLTLEFLDLTRFKGEADVKVDGFTAATLKALGWKPPEEP